MRLHPCAAPLRRLVFCIAMTPLLASLGCGKSGPPRAPIAGRITVGGAPLKAGRILFVPIAPTEGPAASAAIVNGEYNISADQGPVVGKNRVEVEADLPLGFDFDDEAAYARRASNGALPKQPIPSQFNRHSKLEVEIKAGEENTFAVDVPAKVRTNAQARY